MTISIRPNVITCPQCGREAPVVNEWLPTPGYDPRTRKYRCAKPSHPHILYRIVTLDNPKNLYLFRQ